MSSVGVYPGLHHWTLFTPIQQIIIPAIHLIPLDLSLYLRIMHCVWNVLPIITLQGHLIFQLGITLHESGNAFTSARVLNLLLHSSFLSFYPQDKTKTSVSAHTHFHKKNTHCSKISLPTSTLFSLKTNSDALCYGCANLPWDITHIAPNGNKRRNTKYLRQRNTEKSVYWTRYAHVCKPGQSVMLYNKGQQKDKIFSGWHAVQWWW